MEYNFREIEKKWHQKWVENKTYKVTEDENKKKFYVLNMFPYPSGAGLLLLLRILLRYLMNRYLNYCK